MVRTIAFCCCLTLLSVTAWSAWTFTTVNPAGATGDDLVNSCIAWRPQGDYALIAGYDGLYRYDYPSAVLTWDSHPGESLYRTAWAPDGSYALVTGGGHIYRYEHASTGFGALTELTDIQGTGTHSADFYDIAFNPAAPTDPPYISADREILAGGIHEIVIYRYDPAASPQVYWDLSGGLSDGTTSTLDPRAISIHPEGRYLVIANYWGPNALKLGFHTYDLDGTFPPDGDGHMQFASISMGNATAIALRPVPGPGRLILKGTGMPSCYEEDGLPASWDEHPTGAPWHTALTDGGEAAWSYDGSLCLVTERQQWSPYHMVMLFDGNGDSVDHALPVESLGFTNETGVRIRAAAWHPAQPFGLMAGGERWIFSFATDLVPTPTPTQEPTVTATPTRTPTVTDTPEPLPTFTPTPPVVPSTGLSGTMMLVLLLGWRIRRRRQVP